MIFKKSALVFLLICTACAPVMPIAVSDVRNQGRFVRSGEISTPVNKIGQCLDRSDYFCGSLGSEVKYNPDDPNECTLLFYGSGMSRPSSWAIIVFTGTGSGSKFEQYAIAPSWGPLLDKELARIEACGKCDSLPQ